MQALQGRKDLVVVVDVEVAEVAGFASAALDQLGAGALVSTLAAGAGPVAGGCS